MIDLLFLGVVIWAVYKGFQQGFIVAICSFAAFFIGLAAALKLSTVVAAWLGTTFHTGGRWLPFISFVLVMVATAFLVRRMAGLLTTMAQAVLLGWANRLMGVCLMLLLYLCLYSVVLFYLRQMGLLSQQTLAASVTWPYLEPLGPTAIEWLGILIPWFKNMFGELQHFFQGLAPAQHGTVHASHY